MLIYINVYFSKLIIKRLDYLSICSRNVKLEVYKETSKLNKYIDNNNYVRGLINDIGK